jgi:hypothetical protein
MKFKEVYLAEYIEHYPNKTVDFILKNDYYLKRHDSRLNKFIEQLNKEDLETVLPVKDQEAMIKQLYTFMGKKSYGFQNALNIIRKKISTNTNPELALA